MTKPPEEKESARTRNRRVHMANERTFLAWIRTSVGIMAFGFVVERFALFVRQLSLIFGNAGAPPSLQPHGCSRIFGIALVAFGTVMSLFAFIRYRKTAKQIDEDAYHPSGSLDLLLTVAVLIIGLFLVVYLLIST
jgi:putative membrane protein